MPTRAVARVANADVQIRLKPRGSPLQGAPLVVVDALQLRARKPLAGWTRRDTRMAVRAAALTANIATEGPGSARTQAQNPTASQDPASDDERFLNFENWGLDDRYFETLLSSMDQSLHALKPFKLRHINISKNRLTGSSLDGLISSASSYSELLSLDVAGNQLGEWPSAPWRMRT